MGSFNNTKVVNTVNNLVDGYKSRLDNPFYDKIQKSRVVVTYYNINTDATHKDPALGIVEDYIGVDSPIKYNKINNFITYADDITLTTNINDTDFGPENDPYEGRIYILPGTIQAVPGDHFKIPHIKEDLLFQITDVQAYKLESGQTLHELTYILVEAKTHRIEENVIEIYDFIIQNLGTDLNPLILTSNFNLLKSYDSAIDILRSYYLELFFSNSVQSLIYQDINERNIYDEMLTEFCKETEVLSTEDNYIHLANQIPYSRQFRYKFSKTLFNCIIDKDLKRIKSKDIINYGWLESITRMDCIFYTRPRAYFSVAYSDKVYGYLTEDTHIIPFNNELIDAILNNKLIDNDILSNIIIKYFNDISITDNDIEELKYINIENESKQFYYIPVVIFILEYCAKQLMKKEE